MMRPSVWKATTVAALALAAILGLRPLHASRPMVETSVRELATGEAPSAPAVVDSVSPSGSRAGPLVARLHAARRTEDACDALDGLGWLGDGEAMAAIEGALRDRAHTDVRDCAVSALGRVPGDAARGLLTTMLGDQESGVRNPALQALAGRQDDVSRAAVVQVAREGDPGERLVALEALARSRVPGAAELLAKEVDGPPSRTAGVLAGLAATGDAGVVPAVARCTTSASPEVRMAALAAAASIGGPALPLLQAAIGRGGEDASEAVSALAQVDAPDARALLIHAAADPRPEVATAALHALGSFVGEDVRAVVVLQVGSSHVSVATAASRWLALRGDGSAAATLVELIQRSDGDSVGGAVNELAALDTEAARAAIAALASRPGGGRVDALKQLANLPAGAEQARAIATRMVRDEGGRVASEGLQVLVGDVSPEGTQALVAIAHSAGPLQQSAVQALGDRRDEGALVALVDIARDTPDSRLIALEALGGSHDPRATRTLVDAASDPFARSTALASLARTGGADAERALDAAASSTDASARADAARALAGETPPSLVPRLAGLARDPDPDVSEAAFQTLRTASPGSALDVARQSLGSTDPTERAAAAVHMSQLDPDNARPLLLGALHDPDETVVAAAASALSEAGGAEAQQALLDLLTSSETTDDTRHAAAGALRDMGGSAVRDWGDLITAWAPPPTASDEGE